MISITITENEIISKSNDELATFVRERMNERKSEYESLKSTIPNEKSIEKVLAKLRRPCHKDLISRTLKITENQTQNLVEYLLKNNLIEEYSGAKDFYRAKN